MLKLVLDTNTLISAFFWEGNEAELVRRIEKGKAELYLSYEILKEIEEVIRRPKFKEVLGETRPEEPIQKMISISNIIITLKGVKTCRDPKDDKFLCCAVSAKVDYIVSGDEDLLAIGSYENIKIIKTKTALELIGS